MNNELIVYNRGEIVDTIDDFVSTQDIDKKVMFLGAFVDYINNRHEGNKSALYITASILYARILDKLHKEDDKSTRSMINLAISEYMEKAGVDMDKYR